MKIKLRDTIEILGIFAVVLSLLFVGLQLQLDRKVALADQYFNRAESAKADRRALLDSDDHMRGIEQWWADGNRPYFWDEEWDVAKKVADGTYSVRSLEARMLELELSILGYDSVYYQYQQGLLDEELWVGLRAAMKRNMELSPLSRAIYESQARSTIRPVVEEIAKEIDAEALTPE